jgi:outer membrane lipoprotein-sorting protein
MRIGRTVSSWFFMLFFALIFFSHALIAGADDQLSSVIDGIFKRYGALNGLSVPYKREIITKSMAILGAGTKSETASGTILFRPPNCLEVQQTAPGKEILTTDGQTIWYYIAEKNTVYEYPADKLGKEVRLLSDIFTGRIKAGDGFDATQSDLGDKKEYHLKLVPNPAWEEVDHIDLLVERDKFDIRVVEIHDLLGTITRFTMEQMTVRKDLRKKDFTFEAPKGVKTIKE